MTKPAAHVLVDANVARSATEPAKHSTSRACLLAATTLAHKDCVTGAAITPALQTEWQRHASPMMVRWLANMEARGRLRREKDRAVADLRSAVAEEADEGVRAALEKDLHLSEAAVWHTLPVLSQDAKQRGFLLRLAERYATIG